MHSLRHGAESVGIDDKNQEEQRVINFCLLKRQQRLMTLKQSHRHHYRTSKIHEMILQRSHVEGKHVEWYHTMLVYRRA